MCAVLRDGHGERTKGRLEHQIFKSVLRHAMSSIKGQKGVHRCVELRNEARQLVVILWFKWVVFWAVEQTGSLKQDPQD